MSSLHVKCKEDFQKQYGDRTVTLATLTALKPFSGTTEAYVRMETEGKDGLFQELYVSFMYDIKEQQSHLYYVSGSVTGEELKKIQYYVTNKLSELLIPSVDDGKKNLIETDTLLDDQDIENLIQLVGDMKSAEAVNDIFEYNRCEEEVLNLLKQNI